MEWSVLTRFGVLPRGNFDPPTVGIKPMKRNLLTLLALLLTSQLTLAATSVYRDVVVYGGTSGGVIAAVQAARMGKTVALVVVNNHLGGMTSGGLGATDVGAKGNGYIQGVAREFYTRVGQKYGTGTKFTFEPHVAETVFNEMAQQAGVSVYTNQYLDCGPEAGPTDRCDNDE